VGLVDEVQKRVRSVKRDSDLEPVQIILQWIDPMNTEVDTSKMLATTKVTATCAPSNRFVSTKVTTPPRPPTNI
jgi:hypothetical protein